MGKTKLIFRVLAVVCALAMLFSTVAFADFSLPAGYYHDYAIASGVAEADADKVGSGTLSTKSLTFNDTEVKGGTESAPAVFMFTPGDELTINLNAQKNIGRAAYLPFIVLPAEDWAAYKEGKVEGGALKDDAGVFLFDVEGLAEDTIIALKENIAEDQTKKLVAFTETFGSDVTSKFEAGKTYVAVYYYYCVAKDFKSLFATNQTVANSFVTEKYFKIPGYAASTVYSDDGNVHAWGAHSGKQIEIAVSDSRADLGIANTGVNEIKPQSWNVTNKETFPAYINGADSTFTFNNTLGRLVSGGVYINGMVDEALKAYTADSSKLGALQSLYCSLGTPMYKFRANAAGTIYVYIPDGAASELIPNLNAELPLGYEFAAFGTSGAGMRYNWQTRVVSTVLGKTQRWNYVIAKSFNAGDWVEVPHPAATKGIKAHTENNGDSVAFVVWNDKGSIGLDSVTANGAEVEKASDVWNDTGVCQPDTGSADYNCTEHIQRSAWKKVETYNINADTDKIALNITTEDPTATVGLYTFDESKQGEPNAKGATSGGYTELAAPDAGSVSYQVDVSALAAGETITLYARTQSSLSGTEFAFQPDSGLDNNYGGTGDYWGTEHVINITKSLSATFLNKDGSVLETKAFTSIPSVIDSAPTPAAIPGLSFAGWVNQATGDPLVVGTTEISENTTFVSLWEGGSGLFDYDFENGYTVNGAPVEDGTNVQVTTAANGFKGPDGSLVLSSWTNPNGTNRVNGDPIYRVLSGSESAQDKAHGSVMAINLAGNGDRTSTGCRFTRDITIPEGSKCFEVSYSVKTQGSGSLGLTIYPSGYVNNNSSYVSPTIVAKAGFTNWTDFRIVYHIGDGLVDTYDVYKNGVLETQGATVTRKVPFQNEGKPVNLYFVFGAFPVAETGDVVYFDNFKAKAYDGYTTVSFEDENGNVFYKNDKLLYGDSVAVPADPAGESTFDIESVFDGWYIKGDETKTSVTPANVCDGTSLTYVAKFTVTEIEKHADYDSTGMLYIEGSLDGTAATEFDSAQPDKKQILIDLNSLRASAGISNVGESEIKPRAWSMTNTKGIMKSADGNADTNAPAGTYGSGLLGSTYIGSMLNEASLFYGSAEAADQATIKSLYTDDSVPLYRFKANQGGVIYISNSAEKGQLSNTLDATLAGSTWRYLGYSGSRSANSFPRATLKYGADYYRFDTFYAKAFKANEWVEVPRMASNAVLTKGSGGDSMTFIRWGETAVPSYHASSVMVDGKIAAPSYAYVSNKIVPKGKSTDTDNYIARRQGKSIATYDVSISKGDSGKEIVITPEADAVVEGIFPVTVTTVDTTEYTYGEALMGAYNPDGTYSATIPNSVEGDYQYSIRMKSLAKDAYDIKVYQSTTFYNELGYGTEHVLNVTVVPIVDDETLAIKNLKYSTTVKNYFYAEELTDEVFDLSAIESPDSGFGGEYEVEVPQGTGYLYFGDVAVADGSTVEKVVAGGLTKVTDAVTEYEKYDVQDKFPVSVTYTVTNAGGDTNEYVIKFIEAAPEGAYIYNYDSPYGIVAASNKYVRITAVQKFKTSLNTHTAASAAGEYHFGKTSGSKITKLPSFAEGDVYVLSINEMMKGANTAGFDAQNWYSTADTYDKYFTFNVSDDARIIYVNRDQFSFNRKAAVNGEEVGFLTLEEQYSINGSDAANPMLYIDVKAGDEVKLPNRAVDDDVNEYFAKIADINNGTNPGCYVLGDRSGAGNYTDAKVFNFGDYDYEFGTIEKTYNGHTYTLLCAKERVHKTNKTTNTNGQWYINASTTDFIEEPAWATGSSAGQEITLSNTDQGFYMIVFGDFEPAPVPVDTKITVISDGVNGADKAWGEFNGTDVSETNIPYGGEVILKAEASDGRKFNQWVRVDEKGHEYFLSYEPVYTITATATDVTYMAKFDDLVGVDQFDVTMLGRNGETILSGIVTGATTDFGGEFQSADDLPYVIGYTFNGWDVKNGDEFEASTIGAFGPWQYTAFEEGGHIPGDRLVYRTRYAWNRQKDYTVTFVNVKTLNGSEEFDHEYPVAFNTKLTVTPIDAPSGQVFQYWKKNGAIVSYAEEYTMYAPAEDVTLEAVFGDVAPTAQSTVTIGASGESGAIPAILFNSERNIVEGYTVVESGILLGTDSKGTGDNLSMTENYAKVMSNFTTNKGNVTVRVKLTPERLDESNDWYGRGYVIYKNALGKLFTKYSDVLKVNYDGADFTIGE